jgi:hypothetical protein
MYMFINIFVMSGIDGLCDHIIARVKGLGQAAKMVYKG